MGKDKYCVIIDSFEIDHDDLHTDYLPRSISEEEIKEAYLSREGIIDFDPERIATFEDEEEAISFCLEQNFRYTQMMRNSHGRHYRCGVSYVEWIIDTSGDDDEDEYIDHECWCGERCFLAEAYNEDEDEEEE